MGGRQKAGAVVSSWAAHRSCRPREGVLTHGAHHCCAQVPALMFFSFLAFNGVAWLSLRILNRRGQIKHPKNLALLKAGCARQQCAAAAAAATAELGRACCSSASTPWPAPHGRPATAAALYHPCHSVCAASHAIVSLAAALHAVVHRDLSACEGQLFCHDDMSARLMTVRCAGLACGSRRSWLPVAGP